MKAVVFSQGNLFATVCRGLHSALEEEEHRYKLVCETNPSADARAVQGLLKKGFVPDMLIIVSDSPAQVRALLGKLSVQESTTVIFYVPRGSFHVFADSNLRDGFVVQATDEPVADVQAMEYIANNAARERAQKAA